MIIFQMLKTHAEQYRSTFTKKDKIYRKKAKKKAIKTLAKKKSQKHTGWD